MGQVLYAAYERISRTENTSGTKNSNMKKTNVFKKLIENNKISDTRRIITVLGIEIYRTEDNEDVRIQNILGNFIYTKKIKSGIRELKIIKFCGIPISQRITEDDVCSYYCFGVLVSRQHSADLFFKQNLKRIKYEYDDVYILNSNSGEVSLFFAYLVKAFLLKNNSKKPLFVATKKYHVDILKLFSPNIKYVLIDKLKIKTQSDLWETPEHNYYILFSRNHIEKVEKSIKNQEIGSVHHFKYMLNTLNLTENDYSAPQVFIDKNIENKLNEKVNNINLQLNNFIILAPEANTCTELPKTFWVKLAERLKKEKYDIYVNITDEANKIADCKALDLNYQEAYCLAMKAKAIISLRNGLSEFILPTNTPNISIYTKFRKRKENAFSVDKGIEGFSMKKLPFVDKSKIYEINADRFKDENLLVEEVMCPLSKMLNIKEEVLV